MGEDVINIGGLFVSSVELAAVALLAAEAHRPTFETIAWRNMGNLNEGAGKRIAAISLRTNS